MKIPHSDHMIREIFHPQIKPLISITLIHVALKGLPLVGTMGHGVLHVSTRSMNINPQNVE